jgi:hypothetical protein
VRWDWGERVFMDGRFVRNLILQPNKGAKSEVLRRIAGKNSHGKLGAMKIDIERLPTKEIFIEKWRKMVG